VPGVPLDRLSGWRNKKLFKVPGDVCPFDRLPDDKFGVTHQTLRIIRRSGQLFLQVGEQRMFVIPIHLNLVKHFSLWHKTVSGPDMLESVENLLAARVLLVSKLVAGEAEDGQFVRELLTELVHLCKVS